MIKGGEGKRDAGSDDVEGKMGGWKSGRCEEGGAALLFTCGELGELKTRVNI